MSIIEQMLLEKTRILLNRRNILITSMPIESLLVAVILIFLVFSISLEDMMGQSFASLVPTAFT
jgi:NADH-ubiquinone oxidoreductase chain 4L